MKTFQTGDKVVHSPEGVCRIEGICQLEIEKTKRQYYRLKPTTNPNAVLYIPVENIETNVRPLKNKAELEQIFLSEIEVDWFRKINPQKRMLIQNWAICEDKQALLISLIKMYRKNRGKRQISVGDTRWLEKAERYLFSEIAEVLDADYGMLLKSMQGNQKYQCA